MRKSQKFMIAGLVCIVLAAFTVRPTLSWLSDMTDPVVNTFSGGLISIRLDEAEVDADGRAVPGGERVKENHYRYVAGAELDKDPTATVLKGSEECYVFLLVENELNDKFTINFDTESWIKVSETAGKTIYIYKEKVNASGAENDIGLPPLFTKVTISPDLSETDIADLGERKLCVTAFAVQTANIDTQTACELAAEQFGLTDVSVTAPAME